MSSPESGIGRGILGKDWLLRQIQFVEAGHSLRAAAYFQPAIEMPEIYIHLGHAKKQFLGNHPTGKVFNDQMQHFKFTGRERPNHNSVEANINQTELADVS